MLGFSVYLNESLTNERIAQMKAMRNAGFEGVFTSMHIPEDDASCYVPRLKELGTVCRQLGLTLTADVSANGLKRISIDINNIQQLTDLGLTALRVDDGLNPAQIAQLSRQLPVALNASTISASDVAKLHECDANFQHLEAWHNYYPRPATGLDYEWYQSKNNWLKKQGFTTMAFVAGDEELRGPVFAGLPTLEGDRYRHPLASTLNLLGKLATDKVYIGDIALSRAALEQFRLYFQHNILQLSIQTSMASLYQDIWHNRPDVARDVIRLVEGRQKIKTMPPMQTRKRPVGTITVDNSRYGRYMGELEILKQSLSADPRVNVVGQVVTTDLSLLALIGSNQAVQFIRKDEKQ
ncbi:DUF871 domain-containing protein [Lactiplantibacillus plantarum]|uniref:DUF871 domain-containing protein n=1 Tax=Lactiplantibacillus plantarum TaxID=1590 RepID=UPI003F53D1F1